MQKISAGKIVAGRTLRSARGTDVPLPATGGRLTHLQFRRFAGCPMCHLHIREFVRRHAELEAAGIEEIAVFRSSQEDMRKHAPEAPFALIADPDYGLFREFGVESSIRSELHPRALLAGLRGLIRYGMSLPRNTDELLGLPGDFLIAEDGRVLACKYGSHAYDQWSFDELLQIARQHRQS